MVTCQSRSISDKYNYTIDWIPGSIKVSIKEDGQLVDAFEVLSDRYDSGRFGVFNSSQSHAYYTVSVSDYGSDNVYWYDVEASDPDGDALVYRLLDAPEGLWIHPDTGLTRWETTVDQTGSYPVTIEVEDEHGLTATQHYNLVVQEEQPVIVSEPQTVADAGEQYRYLITAIDPNPDDQLTYSLVSGPSGVVVDPSSGLLSWNPTSSMLGSHDMTVRVTDSLGLSDEQTFTVEVVEPEPNDPPVFTSEPVVTVRVGQLYVYTPKAEDPDGDPIQYGLTGELPYHMQIFDGENITWQPGEDQIRDWTITVDARDGKGGVAEQTFTIRVEDITGNLAPSITSQPPVLASPGASYAYDVVASDPDGDPLTYALEQAPEAMSIDAQGGISWVPANDSSGFYPVTVRVEDGRGGYALQEFTIAVNDGLDNSSPVIDSEPNFDASVENIYRYDVEATDADGDALSYQLSTRPEGMAIDPVSGLIEWTPDSGQLGQHAITVEVFDGQGGTAYQSYTLQVQEDANANRAPEIVSSADRLVPAGSNWTYQVQATDPDGDALTYHLMSAPSGLTLDSAGLAEWLPQEDDLGEYPVEIEVRDGRGGTARQQFTLYVVSGTTNNPPQILSTPPHTGRAGYEYQYSVEAEDPEGDPINFTLTQAPPGMSVTQDGLVTWTPSGEVQAQVSVRVDDGSAFTTQSWTIDVSSADAELTLSVLAQPSIVDPGEPVTISAEPSSMAGEYSLEVQVNGAPVALDDLNQAQVQFDASGTYNVSGSLSDAYGTASDSTSFTVRGIDNGPPPSVSISAPGYEAEVTAPTDILGSVDDDDLNNWVLAYTEQGREDWVILAEGNQSFSETNIGTFDPTLLKNGQYRIVLQAWDDMGQTGVESREVTVTGAMKLGHFSMTFEDVTVPLSGIPITLTRTYDTRQRAQHLDFGYGWSVGYKDVRLQENRKVGFGWSLVEYKDSPYFSTWCVQPNGNPIVTVAMPGGGVERFRAKASPECTSIVPTVDVQIEFEPLPGTYSTLEQTDFGHTRLVENNLVDLGDPYVPVDPDRYVLTLQDGTELSVRQGFGVSRIVDPNANTLTFTEDGIHHSSGLGIDFVRDGAGRIEQILLPDGEMLDYVYDANGDLTAFSDERNNVTQFTYLGSAPHYLQDVIDPRGVRAIRNEYDSDGRMVAQIDADGNRLEFDHDIEGRTETITDRRGNTSLYVYDDRGYVISETNALGETTTRTYDEFGNELTRTDALGYTWQSTYDSRGNKTSETNPLGESTSSSFNNRGNLLEQVAADGTTVMSNEYSSFNGQLLSTEDALGNATSFAYDSQGNLTQSTDAAGNVTEYFYDSRGNRIREIDPRGVESTFTHDAMGRVLTETVTWTDGDGNPQNLVTTHEYDANGNRTKTTDPLGAVRISEYDEADQLIAEVDPLGRRTEYEYDDRGNQVLTRHPDGSTETSEYDPEGNLIAQTDRAGRTTRMVYDAAGRQIETILPDATPGDESDNPRRYSIYNAAGHLVEEIDERGNSTRYEYDAAGRNTKVIDALGNETVYEYDARGQRAAMINARGHRTEYKYDSAGRQVKTIHPDGTESSVAYDALGQKSAETDPAGQVTRFEYGPAGNLTAVVDALDQRTEYTYDELGNRISQTDANGHTTTWAFDATGRMLSRTLPLGQTETFQYDAAGQRTSRTDFKGQTLQFDYDALGQPTETIYPDGSSVQTRYTASGQVWEIEVSCTPAPCSVEGKEVGVTVHQYDERDRLTRIEYPDGRWIEYAYDAAGNRTEVGTANQLTRYGFDALSRLETVVDCDDAQCATGLTTQYHYNAAGSRSAVNHANGTTTAYEYDALNRLTDLTTWDSTGQVIHSQVFTLGAAGHRIRVEENDGRVVDYDYDALYRLVEEAVADPRGNRTTTYSFDPVGNRLSRTTSCNPSCSGEIEEGATTYVYDANDRLLEETGPDGTTTYQYDANGNTTKRVAPDGAVDYDYNGDDRLTRATGNLDSGALEVTYAYDAHGIRQRQTVDGLTTRFLVDPTHEHAQVLEELDDSGNPTALYVIGHERISQERAGSYSTFHADGLGSVRSLTNLSGTETDDYVYEAFGQLEHATSTTPNSFRYTGEQYDPNLGFCYLRARYYDPATGRFPTMDTYQGRVHEPQTLHKYLYVHGDPVNNFDPSGNITLGSLMRGVSVVGRLAIRSITQVTRNLFSRGLGSRARKIALRDRIWLQIVKARAKRKLPSAWGRGGPNNKSVGWKWSRPGSKGSDIVRIDRGNPRSKFPAQRPDHVRVNYRGRPIGRDGRPIKGSVKKNPEAAHIPYSEWITWRYWYMP